MEVEEEGFLCGLCVKTRAKEKQQHGESSTSVCVYAANLGIKLFIRRGGGMRAAGNEMTVGGGFLRIGVNSFGVQPWKEAVDHDRFL